MMGIFSATKKGGDEVLVLWISEDGFKSLCVEKSGKLEMLSTLSLTVVQPLPLVNKTEQENRKRKGTVKEFTS